MLKQKDHLALDKILDRSFFLSMKLWKTHKIKEAREIADFILNTQLRRFDAMDQKSRQKLLRISKALCIYDNEETLNDICTVLYSQSYGATQQEQVAIASLLNRMNLLMKPKQKQRKAQLAA